MWKRLMYAACVAMTLILASTSRAIVIGDWEQDMDGWTASGETNVRYSNFNGVTLGMYSLAVDVPNSNWQEAIKINLIDKNLVEAFKLNQKISVDVTRLVADVTGTPAPNWGGLHMAINAGGDGWSVWQEFGSQGNWVPGDGDQTQSVVWSYASALPKMNFNSIWWCELLFFTNYDPAYSGPVLVYLDNMQLFGGGRALNPTPADTAKDVLVDGTLGWERGTYATTHDVYLGTTPASVDAASGASDPNVIFVSVDVTNFAPGVLLFNTPYYWRVDEVNAANPESPWRGPIWSFTTANFIIVDDFERYTNDSPNRVFQTWIDGLGFSPDDIFPEGNPGNGTGAIIGYDPSLGDIMEKANVQIGAQAMPMDYDNKDPKISEAIRTWAQPQNWTLNNYDTMKLYVRGSAENGADRLYITLEDSDGRSATVAHADAAILTVVDWTEWVIPLDSFAGVNPAAITKMVIGVGDPSNPKHAAGRLFIDDIHIALKPIGLVAHYKLDGDTLDSSGNGFDGTLTGNEAAPASYVNGPTGFGKGLLFDGAFGHQCVALGTFNPSAATGQLSVALWAKWDGLSEAWQGLIGKRQSNWAANGMMWQIEANQTNGSLHFQREGGNDLQLTTSLRTGQWTHVAVTFDGTTAKGYINGALVGQTMFSFGFGIEAPLQIGSSTADGGNPFNGALDEVRIYDRVLSETEIKQLAGK